MSSDGSSGRLRPCLWSSETLVAGARAISNQPSDLLVKDEDDPDLVQQYQEMKDSWCLINLSLFDNWMGYLMFQPLLEFGCSPSWPLSIPNHKACEVELQELEEQAQEAGFRPEVPTRTAGPEEPTIPATIPAEEHHPQDETKAHWLKIVVECSE